MEMFTGATETTIYRSCFSNIEGNQYINNYYGPQTGGKEGKVNRDLPELAEYTEVKRGDILKIKDVCHLWRLCSNGKEDTEAAVYTAQIMISGHFRDSKFTVKTYHGRNGEKEWQQDFQRCSKDWQRDIPLFGYNKSSVPSLIFHGELVPIVHVAKQVGLMGQIYVGTLTNALRCSTGEIWMDPVKGTFCRGPTGSECLGWFHQFSVSEISLDIEFLKEDVVIRFLSSKKHDSLLLRTLALNHSGRSEGLKKDPSVFYRHVISSTTNSIIAIDRNVRWKCCNCCCLCFDGMTADSATRFLLEDHGRQIIVWSPYESESWLPQASSVFDDHNIRFDEDLSNFKYIYPSVELKGALQSSKIKHQRRQLWWPIYLFVLLSPSPNTRFYFWSHDPSGRNPFLPDMCKYLGLPITLSITWKYYCRSWSTEIYRILHDYQVVRGFNPKTTDFAQSLGYPLFEVMSPENRFCEVDNKQTHPTLIKLMRMTDRSVPHLPNQCKELPQVPF